MACVGRFGFRLVRGRGSRRRRICLRVWGGSRLSNRGLRDRRRGGARAHLTRNPSASRVLTIRRSRLPMARATSSARMGAGHCSGLGCRSRRLLLVVRVDTRLDDSRWERRLWRGRIGWIASRRWQRPRVHRDRLFDGARVGWVHRVMESRTPSRGRQRRGCLLKAVALRLTPKDPRPLGLRRWAALHGRFSRHGTQRGRRGLLKRASDRVRYGRMWAGLRLIRSRFGTVEADPWGLVFGRHRRR